MYCNKCGTKLADTDRFCGNCGAPSPVEGTGKMVETTRERCPTDDGSSCISKASLHRIVWLVIILAVAVVGGMMMGREFIYRTNTISECRLKFEQLRYDSSLSPEEKDYRRDELCEWISNGEHVRFEIGLATAAGGLGLLVVWLIPFWIAKGVRALDRRCGPNKRSRFVTVFGWVWTLACGWIFIGMSIVFVADLFCIAESESEYAEAERLFRQGNYVVRRGEDSLRVDIGKAIVWLKEGENKDDLFGKILDERFKIREEKKERMKDLILCLLIGSAVWGMPMWIVRAERRARR